MYLSYLYVFLGVQKERMVDEDMYVLSSNGSVLFSPLPKGYPHKAPKCSDCAPLFMKVHFYSFAILLSRLCYRFRACRSTVGYGL